MAEGGARLLPDDCEECCSTLQPEQSRLHTERLVSNRSRETERKISFPERGFRQPAQQHVPLEAVVADPFGEQDEQVQEGLDVVDQEELVQARNLHPVVAAAAPAAAAAGFADRQASNGSVRWHKFFVSTTGHDVIHPGRHLIDNRKIVNWRVVDRIYRSRSVLFLNDLEAVDPA